MSQSVEEETEDVQSFAEGEGGDVAPEPGKSDRSQTGLSLTHLDIVKIENE